MKLVSFDDAGLLGKKDVYYMYYIVSYFRSKGDLLWICDIHMMYPNILLEFYCTNLEGYDLYL